MFEIQISQSDSFGFGAKRSTIALITNISENFTIYFGPNCLFAGLGDETHVQTIYIYLEYTL